MAKKLFSSEYQPENRRGPALKTQLHAAPAEVQAAVYNAMIDALKEPNESKAAQRLLQLEESEDLKEWGYLGQIIRRELMGKNAWLVLQDILDRVLGKPKQITENYNENNNTSDEPAIVIFKEPAKRATRKKSK